MFLTLNILKTGRGAVASSLFGLFSKKINGIIDDEFKKRDY